MTSLSDFETDALYNILEYLTRHDLWSFGLTSHFFNKFVLDNPQTGSLFLPFGRRYWKNLYNMKKLLIGNNASRAGRTLNRLGILTREQEDASLAYDNYATVDQDSFPHPCAGYFGFCFLPKEVAVWGDFSGVSFLPDPEAFVSKSRQPNGILLGESLQVMAVCRAGKFVFWGCASGEIHCTSVETKGNCDNHSDIQEYPYISGNSEHSNEITSLAKVGKENGHLASGSVMLSQVLVHWHALKDGNLERTSRIEYDLESPLSLASCEVDGQIFLSVGGSNQTLYHSFWSADALIPSTYNLIDSSDVHTNMSSPTLSPLSISGNVVYLSYLGSPSPRLVVGTSEGNLLVATVCYPDMGLEEDYSLVGCCEGGCVNSVELVGREILITCGGIDGLVKFWNFESGAFLTNLCVHPGRCPSNCQQKLCSAVVATYFCHKRSSLLSLCRDGHIREWRLEEELQKAEKQQVKVEKEKKRPIELNNSIPRKSRRTRRVRTIRD